MASIGIHRDILHQLTGIPLPTLRDLTERLRRCDPPLVSRGVQGPHAPDVPAPEIINLLIAAAIGGSVGRTLPDQCALVRSVRAGRRLEVRGAEVLRGLLIERAATAGEALDGLLEDMRAGHCVAWPADAPTAQIKAVRFVDRGRLTIFNFERGSQTATVVFRNDDVEGSLFLRHSAEVDGFVFERIAGALTRPN